MVLHYEAGHAGHPFNECADAMCTFYAKNVDQIGRWTEDSPARSLARDTCAAQWISWFGIPRAEASQYPVIIEGDDAFMSTGACPLGNLE